MRGDPDRKKVALVATPFVLLAPAWVVALSNLNHIAS